MKINEIITEDQAQAERNKGIERMLKRKGQPCGKWSALGKPLDGQAPKDGTSSKPITKPTTRSKGMRSLGGKFGGTLGILPSLLGAGAARERAKKYTRKDDPSFMDTMQMMFPALGKPRKKHGLNPGDA